MKTLFIIGSIILFFGLLWLLLPHTIHEKFVLTKDDIHIRHIYQGIILIILGLVVMVVSNKLEKK